MFKKKTRKVHKVMIVSAVNQKLKFVVQGINQYVDT